MQPLSVSEGLDRISECGEWKEVLVPSWRSYRVSFLSVITLPATIPCIFIPYFYVVGSLSKFKQRKKII